MLLFFHCFSLFFVTISSSSSSSSSFHQIISPPLSAPPPPPKSPLKPTVLIIVVVITLIFSITFLLLLYVKHSNRSHNFNLNNNINRAATGSRKNSGIDRMVIESLPVFRFGSLRGQKEGLECAVCLNIFEQSEYLKLLPKCNHAFHVNCVDTWLDAHSTCPLCRYRVYPEDILLINHHAAIAAAAATGGGGGCNDDYVLQNQDEEDVEMGTFRRVSGRHSSAEERGRSSSSVKKNLNLNRISLDSSRELLKKKRIDREARLGYRRKDGLLVTAEEGAGCFERRFSHRIVVSGDGDDDDKWSNVDKTEDLLYLRSEMIISGSRRFSGV